MSTALIVALKERRRELAARSIAEMYRDPFWTQRFGERGRKFADEDGLHHVDYLVRALEAGTSEVLTEYARWLQVVLTARGMCSEHLRENFERLARLVVEAGLPDAQLAARHLADAQQALQYPSGIGREVQETAARLGSSLSGLGRDAQLLLSYLADALNLEQPELFEKHVAWLRANGHAGTDSVLEAIARHTLPEAARALVSRCAP